MTLESITNWESKKQLAAKRESSSSSHNKSSALSLSPTSTKVGSPTSCFESWKRLPALECGNASQLSLGGISNDSVLTMAALEHVLDKNPERFASSQPAATFRGRTSPF
jgi:hypothetical protein